MKGKGYAIIVVVTAALAGCAMPGPGYQPPPAELPAAWHGAGIEPGPGPAEKQVDLARWWASFRDPVLDRLVSEAITANHDLRLATGRLREARARQRGAAAALAPAVAANAQASHQRSSANGPLGHQPGMALEGNLYEAGFDANWELDFFGGVRRAAEAAAADAEAAEEQRRDVQVSLLAELGRGYVQLRGLDERLDLARRTLNAQSEVLRLVRVRLAAGLATDLEVAQAEGLASSTSAQVPVLDTQREQTIYRIALLCGRQPATLLADLGQPAALPAPAASAGMPLGLPSDLLRRRPDIRAAERGLAAAMARRGAAAADLYPRFLLTGAAGVQSLEAAELFTGASRFFSLGPVLRWPVLDFGRIRANIEVQDSRIDQALAIYEKSILTSLSEVESGLVAINQEEVRAQALTDTVRANQRAADLAADLYRQGLSSYLAVLDSERQLYQAQDSLAQSRTALLQNSISLYKALGGGWDE